jgi:hypothetical protein
MNSNYVKTLFVVLLGVSVTTLTVQVKAISPYNSGYSHGCDDARGGHYLSSPGKGAAFHTAEFMNGYYAGLNACSRPQAHAFPCAGGSGKNYCTGYHEGAVAADNDDSSGRSVGFRGCPVNHSAEYCRGYERGYNDEAGVLG